MTKKRNIACVELMAKCAIHRNRTQARPSKRSRKEARRSRKAVKEARSRKPVKADGAFQ